MPTGVKAKAPRVKPIDSGTVTAGSDNVFADIGLPNPELYQAKAHFVRALRNAIKHRKLDHLNAAAILKIAPDKLEALLRGQTKSYTIDRLVRMVNALGHSVEIVISPVEPGVAAFSVR